MSNVAGINFDGGSKTSILKTLKSIKEGVKERMRNKTKNKYAREQV